MTPSISEISGKLVSIDSTETRSDVPDGTTMRQSLVGNAYSFAAPVLGGLYKYKVVYGTTTDGIDTPLAISENNPDAATESITITVPAVKAAGGKLCDGLRSAAP